MNALKYLKLHEEVRGALAAGLPVVALESTIISHGMPHPQNLETARAVEAAVRAGGAVPATIALMDGWIQVGLDADSLSRLATEPGVQKVSRRDLPVVLSRRQTGATTVAATMIAAGLAGIRLFATGGVGGVHRGGESSLDVSADLAELARTDVAVVCAGAKAILDLPRTLEYLETRGVPVLGYRTDDFPAFYTRESGLSVDARLDTPAELARVLRTKWDLGLTGGVLIANPVSQADAMPRAEIDAAVEQALNEAGAQKVSGKAVTPFLLSRVAELTGGASLRTNIALVKHNAEVAAQIAVALAGVGV